MAKVKRYIDKAKGGFRQHLADSTSIVTFYLPISGAVEKFCNYVYWPISKAAEIAGYQIDIPEPMTDSVSLYSRGFRAGLVYLGLGYAFGSLRDYSKRKFGITEESREKVHKLHDALFTGAFWTALGIPLYLAAGETDMKKIIPSSIVVGTLNMMFGGFYGHYLDIFRELTGVKESKRTPSWLKLQNSKIKKGIAALSIAGLVTLAGLVYYLTPPKQEGDWFYKQPTKIESIDNQERANKASKLEQELQNYLTANTE